MINPVLAFKAEMPQICSLPKVDNFTLNDYEEIESLNKKFFQLYSVKIKRFEEKDDHAENFPNFVATLKLDLISSDCQDEILR